MGHPAAGGSSRASCNFDAKRASKVAPGSPARATWWRRQRARGFSRRASREGLLDALRRERYAAGSGSGRDVSTASETRRPSVSSLTEPRARPPGPPRDAREPPTGSAEGSVSGAFGPYGVVRRHRSRRFAAGFINTSGRRFALRAAGAHDRGLPAQIANVTKGRRRRQPSPGRRSRSRRSLDAPSRRDQRATSSLARRSAHRRGAPRVLKPFLLSRCVVAICAGHPSPRARHGARALTAAIARPPSSRSPVGFSGASAAGVGSSSSPSSEGSCARPCSERTKGLVSPPQALSLSSSRASR